MKRSLLPLLAAPALVAFAPALGPDLAFAPAEGLVLTKSFTMSDVVTMDEVTAEMNGTPQDQGMSEMEQETRNELHVVVIDEYGPTADGRPTVLTRTYDTISSSADMTMTVPMMGEMEMSMVGESELEGEVVRFTWNADRGAYDVAFADDQGSDEALLDELTEDTDLRGVLPTEEVAEGDTWEVRPQVFRDVLAFGGALKLDVEVEGDGPMVGMAEQEQPAPHEFLGEMDGDVVATYAGNRDHEGQTVAVIELAVDVSTAKDMTEFFQEAMEEADMEGMEMDVSYNSADMEYEFEGNAVVLWSLDGGHLVSLEMNGDTATTMDMDMDMAMQGQEMNMVTSVFLTGTQTVSLGVESSSAE